MDGLLEGGLRVFVIIIAIIYWLIIPLLGGWVATQKGYSSTSWFLLCFFFSVFALIAICGAPINPTKRSINYEKAEYSNLTWKCPKCNNKNPNNTFKCEKCNYSLK